MNTACMHWNFIEPVQMTIAEVVEKKLFTNVQSMSILLREVPRKEQLFGGGDILRIDKDIIVSLDM